MVTMMMMTTMMMRMKVHCESALIKVETDKLMDKNFKKEFPGLGFHQVALLVDMVFLFFLFVFICTFSLKKELLDFLFLYHLVFVIGENSKFVSKVDSLYKLFKKRPKAAERVEKSAEAWGQQKHDSR